MGSSIGTLESQSSTANIKIPLSEIDLQFDKWYKEDQVLSGVLNVRVTKQKNVDFKLKLKTWSLRDKDRKRIKNCSSIKVHNLDQRF